MNKENKSENQEDTAETKRFKWLVIGLILFGFLIYGSVTFYRFSSAFGVWQNETVRKIPPNR